MAASPIPVTDNGGSLTVDVGTALPAGTNNIGDVDVLTLPALAAGTNNIGDVDVLTLPALPAGTNNIGDVDVLTLPALPAGANNIGDVDVLTLPAIFGAASVDINAAVTADVDAAVAAVANLRLLGFSIRESAGTPAVATVQIVNGATGAAAGKIATVELAANASVQQWFGPQGIDCSLGISIDHVAGEVDVYLYHITAA